jgi:hypothetical protein
LTEIPIHGSVDCRPIRKVADENHVAKAVAKVLDPESCDPSEIGNRISLLALEIPQFSAFRRKTRG